jgi:hypothetical protein
MKSLKQREKTLAIVTGVLLVLIVGRWLFSAWEGPVSKLRAQQANLRGEIERKQRLIKRGQEAQSRLTGWNGRSLPSDLDMARSLYQNWLLTLTMENRFDGVKVEAGQGRQRGSVYHALRFNLQAQTTLEHLTRFLHRFYSAGHLHQIRSLSLVPIQNSKKLELQVAIEALALAGADRKDKLSEALSPRLKSSDRAAYRVIAERNLFAAYQPPPPPQSEEKPSPPPPIDPSKYAFLTAIVQSGGTPEAWLLERITGKRWQLHQGDTFEVGDLKGKVLRIERHEVEIEVDGQRSTFPLGDSLRDSVKPAGS